MTELERDCSGCACTCGGYADRLGDTNLTDKEIDRLDCGRGEYGVTNNKRWAWGCCIAAFLCRLCERRFIRDLAAPEMSW